MTTPDSRDDRWTDRLSEYLDGGLEPGERVELEAHLAGCAWCSAVLDDLGTVVQRSRTLETPPPASDLWPGIRAQIEASQAPATTRRPLDIRRHRDWGAWRFSLSVPQAAAAGLALALLSAGGMWLAMRPPATSRAPLTASREPAPAPGPAAVTPAGGTEPVAATPGPAGAPSGTAQPRLRPDPSSVALAAFSDPRYDATVAELQRILAEGRGQLDTSTVRILEQNLAIIDRALADARRAVAADPANSYLRSHLASTMRRKVDLLRRATVIVGAHG